MKKAAEELDYDSELEAMRKCASPPAAPPQRPLCPCLRHALHSFSWHSTELVYKTPVAKRLPSECLEMCAGWPSGGPLPERRGASLRCRAPSTRLWACPPPSPPPPLRRMASCLQAHPQSLPLKVAPFMATDSLAAQQSPGYKHPAGVSTLLFICIEWGHRGHLNGADLISGPLRNGCRRRGSRR